MNHPVVYRRKGEEVCRGREGFTTARHKVQSRKMDSEGQRGNAQGTWLCVFI